MVLVAKASDIAKKIAIHPKGTIVGMIFGKIFEQLYNSKNQVTNPTDPRSRYPDPFILRIFTYDLKNLLELHNIYSVDLLREGVKMYIALHREGVTGIGVPPTFRKYADEIYIAAQPDLYNPYLDEYFEIKTYPIDEYSKTQAKIFAWVLDHRVVLVGLRKDGNDYKVETMVIEPKPLNIDPEIVRSVAREQPIDPGRCIPPHRLFRHNRPDDEDMIRARRVALEV